MAAGNRRAGEERLRLVLSCRLLSKGAVSAVVVTNISRHGVEGRTRGALRPEDAVQIILPGIGEVDGEVRWVEGPKFGLHVPQVISITEIVSARRRERRGRVKPSGAPLAASAAAR